jgi:hypothetical protein
MTTRSLLHNGAIALFLGLTLSVVYFQGVAERERLPGSVLTDLPTETEPAPAEWEGEEAMNGGEAWQEPGMAEEVWPEVVEQTWPEVVEVGTMTGDAAAMGGTPVCGDGVCDVVEGCSLCPEDCGAFMLTFCCQEMGTCDGPFVQPAGASICDVPGYRPAGFSFLAGSEVQRVQAYQSCQQQCAPAF